MRSGVVSRLRCHCQKNQRPSLSAASSGTEQHSGSTWSLPTRLYFPAEEAPTGSQSFKWRARRNGNRQKNSTLSASNETLLPSWFLERTPAVSVGEEARGAATPKIATRRILGKDGTLGLSFLQGQSKLWRAIEEFASSRPMSTAALGR